MREIGQLSRQRDGPLPGVHARERPNARGRGWRDRQALSHPDRPSSPGSLDRRRPNHAGAVVHCHGLSGRNTAYGDI